MGRMQRTASSEPWCGHKPRGAGLGTGRVAGGGTGGPDPGFPTRAPCPSEAGEEQQGVGDTRGHVVLLDGDSHISVFALVAGLPPVLQGCGCRSLSQPALLIFQP